MPQPHTANSRPDRRRREHAPRRLVSVTHAAAYADLSTRTVYRYIQLGYLTGYRVGPRLVKVSLDELDKLAKPIPAASAKTA